MSNFLDELSIDSIVFLCQFALIILKGFLISPCYFGELCIQMVYISFSPLPFTSFLFSVICKVSSDNHFAFLHFFFLGMVLTPGQYSYGIQSPAMVDPLWLEREPEAAGIRARHAVGVESGRPFCRQVTPVTWSQRERAWLPCPPPAQS